MLFTFPSRYWYTIGQTGILRLTQRSGRIHTGFHEARATRDTTPPDHARSATGPSPSTARYPTRFASHTVLSLAAGASAPARPLPRHQRRNPRRVSHGTGLAIIRFRSPLLTEYPFLQVLRCFTSLRTPRTKLCGAGPQQPAGYPIRTPSDQSPVGGSPRPIAAPHVLHRYCLPRHPPYAHGNKPTNPRKRGPTGPCHLHWNTLRQLIRSSKTPPTPTRAWTAYQNTREHNPRTHPKAGTERFDKINSTNTPGTPHRAHRSCSRPLSSSQTTTPHHPKHPPHKGRGQDGGNGTPPPTRGLAVREPNSMHHTTVHPHHKGAGALTFSQPARDATRPGSRERKHPHIGALPCAHKTP